MTQPTNDPAQPQKPASPAVQEEVIYEGSPGMIGRLGAFLWTFVFAGILVLIPILLLVSGVAVPWYVTAGAIVLALLLILLQVVYHRSLRFRVTNYCIDFERGLLTKRIDSLQLWHVDDISFQQGILERMRGAGTITVIAEDRSSPRLQMRGLPGGRQVFERTKGSILAAKRQRGILEVDRPQG